MYVCHKSLPNSLLVCYQAFLKVMIIYYVIIYKVMIYILYYINHTYIRLRIYIYMCIYVLNLFQIKLWFQNTSIQISHFNFFCHYFYANLQYKINNNSLWFFSTKFAVVCVCLCMIIQIFELKNQMETFMKCNRVAGILCTLSQTSCWFLFQHILLLTIFIIVCRVPLKKLLLFFFSYIMLCWCFP